MKDKKKWYWITSLVILLPCVAGLLLWDVLPEKLPTHWGMNGQMDGWSGKGLGILLMPLIELAAHWLVIASFKWDSRNGGNKTFQKICLWIFPVISIVSMAVIYGSALGLELSMSGVMMAVIGLLFICMGNFMPKLRQNAIMGIRLPWTLYSEENWNRTHRFGGKCWVAGGVGFLALSLVPEKWFGGILVGMVILLAAVPTLYSYLLYRKQRRAGTWKQSEGSRSFCQASPLVNWLIRAAVIGLVTFTAVMMFTGTIEMVYHEDCLEIEASYWEDLTVPYEAITAVEYRDEKMDGTREWGFGSPRLLMGAFENEEFGLYTRYTYTGCDACVVVWLGEDVLVLSGRDAASTEEICARLMEKIQ